MHDFFWVATFSEKMMSLDITYKAFRCSTNKRVCLTEMWPQCLHTKSEPKIDLLNDKPQAVIHYSSNSQSSAFAVSVSIHIQNMIVKLPGNSASL